MKWFGEIGYFEETENVDGVTTNTFQTQQYYGDIIKNYKTNTDAGTVNEDFDVNNRISVVADPYLIGHFHRIAWITFMDVKFKVHSVELQYPRLIVSLGGVYREEDE